MLDRPVPAWAALTVAFVIGVGYALAMLGWDFVAPGSRYWVLPEGHSGGLVDSRLVLSGYYWFVQDAWRWPLFHIAQANGAVGANAALMDPVPVLALAMKLVRGVTGVVNPYPGWVVGCFGLNAAALAALVRGLGQRSLLAAVVAGAMGAMAPLVHLRFGHFALEAQWCVVFALAAYAAHAAGRLTTAAAGWAMVGLSLLAFGIAIYLYVMVAAVAASFLLQAALDRRMGVTAAAGFLVLVLAAAVVPFWVLGLAGQQDIAVETVPFGYASMNLVSPFWPQTSGVFARTGVYALTRGTIGATAGQYEGYAYLGAGMLVLLAACAGRPVAWRWLSGAGRRHWVLAAALLVLVLWAVSNRVYLGDRLVLSYPLPEVLLRTVLAWFRASGRFFWPLAWLLCGLGVAGVLACYRPRVAVPLLVVGLLLQWVDLGLWRERLGGLVTKPPVSAFGTPAESAGLEAEVARLGAARVVPAQACTAQAGQYEALPTIAGIELQLLAARRDARMESIVLARNQVDCAAERATPIGALAGRGLVLVLEQPRGQDRRDEARREMACRPTPPGLICVPR